MSDKPFKSQMKSAGCCNVTINLIYFFLSSKLISRKPSFSLPRAERQTADTPRHLEVKSLTMLMAIMVVMLVMMMALGR